jgi:energy-coupling factor transporter ATP-binding protein EcfA2
MRILSLEIQNVRGIKDRLIFSPEGENFLIYGPNGTGKSAIVDAIDFLFSGRISRLVGKGTKNISLKKHGPHIDAKRPESAAVKATIRIPDVTDPIEIERKISNPNNLIYACPENKKDALEEVLGVAKRGHYVLSRREILKFIAAESGERAQEVQAVLNLETVEEIRKSLVGVKTDAQREDQSAEVQLKISKSAITTALSLDSFSEEVVLKKISDLRGVLGGTRLSTLTHENLQKDLKPPSLVEGKTIINIDLLTKDVEAAKKIIKDHGEAVYSNEEKLRGTLRKLKEDVRLMRDLASRRLVGLGLSLIDESGACPLCLTEWRPGELKPFLEGRLLKAKEASEIETEIRQLSTTINGEISILGDHLERIKNSCQILRQNGILIEIQKWVDILAQWSKDLADPLEKYDIEEMIPEDIRALYAYSGCDQDFETIRKAAIAVSPELSPEQKAWDALTRLSSDLKRYFEAKETKESTEFFSVRATTALNEYEKSKDKILTSLYDSVKNDFVNYYKELHGKDENGFDAKLQPGGAGLDFGVDFYGRGYHPPIALHSEGHQDSMGLCLYLALSKRLSEGKIALTVLDDVVMSIDADHRRDMCKLLKSHFPDGQFLLTTHDRTWARQLNTDGIVSKKNMVEFKSWLVDTGPSYMEDVDFWDKIQKDIDDNDIPSAAAKLRRNSEYFFERACDSLLGKIIYKGDGRWELGDYLPGAIEAFKKHLKQAKVAAQSWGDDKKFQEIEELESVANEIIKRAQVEQWGINENVHYSKWGEFSKTDFEPIVEGFKDLHDLFKCSKCQGLLFVTLKDKDPQDLRCLCGQVNYNLLRK